MEKLHDVFISHASPDKDGFVRPLAEALKKLGVDVWYDEFSINLGDSIAGAIDTGIAQSAFGIIVISVSFINRSWTRHELQALIGRNVEDDLRIIPIWHGVTKDQVASFSPSLADKMAIDTQQTDATEAAIKILRIVRPDIYSTHSRAELEEITNGAAIRKLQKEIDELREKAAELQERIEEYQCPYCGSELSNRISAPADPEEKYWDVRETFDCGFQRFGGVTETPCTEDPNFPKFEEYDVSFYPPAADGTFWRCYAWPKTEMAGKVHIQESFGRTQDASLQKLKLNYAYRAGHISNWDWNKKLRDLETNDPSESNGNSEII